MYLDARELPEELTITMIPMMSENGYFTTHDTPLDGYTVLGEAVEVTFKLKPREEINNELVSQLKKQLQTVRAKAETECQQIEEKIQSLLALPSS